MADGWGNICSILFRTHSRLTNDELAEQVLTYERACATDPADQDQRDIEARGLTWVQGLDNELMVALDTTGLNWEQVLAATKPVFERLLAEEWDAARAPASTSSPPQTPATRSASPSISKPSRTRPDAKPANRRPCETPKTPATTAARPSTAFG